MVTRNWTRKTPVHLGHCTPWPPYLSSLIRALHSLSFHTLAVLVTRTAPCHNSSVRSFECFGLTCCSSMAVFTPHSSHLETHIRAQSERDLGRKSYGWTWHVAACCSVIVLFQIISGHSVHIISYHLRQHIRPHSTADNPAHPNSSQPSPICSNKKQRPPRTHPQTAQAQPNPIQPRSPTESRHFPQKRSYQIDQIVPLVTGPIPVLFLSLLLSALCSPNPFSLSQPLSLPLLPTALAPSHPCSCPVPFHSLP